jgi:hypothetical protein
MKRTILVAVAVAATSCVHAFVSCPAMSRTTHVSLNMGLFDGVKEAFGADGMGDLSSERETPIDRWMGWNAKSVDTPQEAVGSKGMSIYHYYDIFSPSTNIIYLLTYSIVQHHLASLTQWIKQITSVRVSQNQWA